MRSTWNPSVREKGRRTHTRQGGVRKGQGRGTHTRQGKVRKGQGQGFMTGPHSV